MNGFINNIKYIARKSSANKINAYSAQTAFFMFFSLIPIVILALSLINQVGTSEETITAVASEIAPGVLSTFFSTYMDEVVNDSDLSLTIVSAVVLLWSASKGIFAIIGGLNTVYEIKENRNYFLLRLIAMFYTIAFIVILLAALLLMVFGEQISNLFYSLVPNLTAMVYIISSLRFILGFVALVLFFAVMYKALPSGKQRLSDQIPGAIITSAGWVSFSILFSFFVENFSNYANIYGSLTAIIVLMLWMYVCMYIMFLGAEINLILTVKTKNS